MKHFFVGILLLLCTLLVAKKFLLIDPCLRKPLRLFFSFASAFDLTFLTCVVGHGFYLAIGGAIIQHGFSYIQNVIQDQCFNCQLVDVSEDMAMISVQGPKRYTVILFHVVDDGLGWMALSN